MAGLSRRDFLRMTAAGTAVIGAGGYRVYAKPMGEDALLAERTDVPVIASSSVLVLGGSLAAISAATTLADAGKSVYLLSSRTYLGDDICGEYRYWLPQGKTPETPLLKKLFPGGAFSRPFDVKRALDDELLSRGIPFLFNSYVVDVLFDGGGRASGVIIANRTGLQIIAAGTIIDATRWASAARLAGAKTKPFVPGTYRARFVTVGSGPAANEKLESRVMPEVIKLAKRECTGHEYTIPLKMKGHAQADLAKAEQEVRDSAWAVTQEGTAEDYFGLNYGSDFLKIECGKSSVEKQLAPKDLDAACFTPKGIAGLYLLSDCADVSASAAESLFGDHDSAIRTGEALGKAVLKAGVRDGDPRDARKGKGAARKAVYGDDFFRKASPQGELKRMSLCQDTLPVWGKYDVLVVGGGTGGAPAGIAAARSGAKTLVCEQLHGLGGIGTLGLIGRYWYGYRKGFTAEIDRGVKALQDQGRPTGQGKSFSHQAKMQWYRSEILKAGGEIWFDALACGAVLDGKTVRGAVIATPYGKGIVLANTVIDATGSADVAIAAGAAYRYSDGDSVAVQGAGLHDTGPDVSYHNSDWTFIDDGDVFDLWRVFVTARQQYTGLYDLGQLPKTRERRRVVGDLEINAMDIFNHRTYPDTVSHHYSNFDTHGFTVTPYFFMQPKHKTTTADVPFRCLTPKGLDGIVVTGLGASCHRDAMPVIRMQPCVQNQGYAMGLAAAMVAKKGQTIRRVDLKALQKQLVGIGNLNEAVLTAKDNFGSDGKAVEKALETIGGKDLKGLEALLWDRERSVPAMKKRLAASTDKAYRTRLALILGHLGHAEGVDELIELVNSYKDWDKGWNFRGMGQFGASGSKMDSAVIALGKTQSKKVVPALIRVTRMVNERQAFSHWRAVSVAAENVKAPELAPPLAELLKMEGVQGHAVRTIQDAVKKRAAGRDPSRDTSTRNKSLRELFLARGLYRCGDHEGLGEKILKQYAQDLRGHYARHALGILAKG